MSKKYGLKIIELRLQGKSYNQIAKELDCSLGTISKFLCDKPEYKLNLKCGPNPTVYYKHILTRKYNAYHRVFKFNETRTNKQKINHILTTKLYNYQKDSDMSQKFTLSELKLKIGDNPTCYLTGQSINLNDASDYQLDHKIPRSRGGNNSLDNLGICKSNVNMAKRNMTPDEFINLCKQVSKYNQ